MKIEIGPLNNGTLVFSDKITTCQVKTNSMIVRLIFLNIIMISKCVDSTFIDVSFSKYYYILGLLYFFNLHIAT